MMTTGFLRHLPFVLVLVLLLSPSSVSGQTSNEEDEPKTPPWLVLAFEHRTRVEKLTNRFRIDELGATRVLAFRTRFYFEIRERTDPFRFVVELQDSRSRTQRRPLHRSGPAYQRARFLTTPTAARFGSIFSAPSSPRCFRSADSPWTWGSEGYRREIACGTRPMPSTDFTGGWERTNVGCFVLSSPGR